MSQLGSITAPVRRAAVGFVVFVAMAVGLATFGAGAAAAAGDRTLVAKTPGGRMYSKVVGSTAGGADVTGSFTPVKFVKRDGKVFVRGFLEGTVERANGSTSKFSGIKRMRVKTINGEAIRQGRISARPSCDILNLVLAPLDLDVLGLQVHLDRVVLRIVAVGGAGNLLGNLLCAVVGLLDGGLEGLLGRLTRLLNNILGSLRLGV
jgi:hypothetical protein